MTVTADTNVLVRLMVQDDSVQAAASDRLLRSASKVILTLACLCEYVWVLRRLYRLPDEEIASGIEALQQTENVQVDRAAVQAGLLLLRAGGDFADGAIAHEGRRLGGETFVSFDKKAVALIRAQGYAARTL